MARKRGRPRKPLELHLLAGSYRADRHGPLPARTISTGAASVPAPSVPVDAVTGASFMAAVKVRWNVDDVVGATILAETGAALDRAQRLAVLMDGAAPGVASGQVSARILDALTKAHSAAMAIFTDGVDRLDLEKTIAAPVRRQGGV